MTLKVGDEVVVIKKCIWHRRIRSQPVVGAVGTIMERYMDDDNNRYVLFGPEGFYINEDCLASTSPTEDEIQATLDSIANSFKRTSERNPNV